MTRAPEDIEPGVIANLEKFLDAVEQMDMGPLHHFTCTEAEALAALMTAHRGAGRGEMVIIHHMVDADGDGSEEEGELQAHLDRWPDLASDLRRIVSDDDPIIELLNDLEAEQ